MQSRNDRSYESRSWRFTRSMSDSDFFSGSSGFFSEPLGSSPFEEADGPGFACSIPEAMPCRNWRKDGKEPALSESARGRFVPMVILADEFPPHILAMMSAGGFSEVEIISF